METFKKRESLGHIYLSAASIYFILVNYWSIRCFFNAERLCKANLGHRVGQKWVLSDLYGVYQGFVTQPFEFIKVNFRTMFACLVHIC